MTAPDSESKPITSVNPAAPLQSAAPTITPIPEADDDLADVDLGHRQSEACSIEDGCTTGCQ